MRFPKCRQNHFLILTAAILILSTFVSCNASPKDLVAVDPRTCSTPLSLEVTVWDALQGVWCVCIYENESDNCLSVGQLYIENNQYSYVSSYEGTEYSTPVREDGSFHSNNAIQYFHDTPNGQVEFELIEAKNYDYEFHDPLVDIFAQPLPLISRVHFSGEILDGVPSGFLWVLWSTEKNEIAFELPDDKSWRIFKAFE